MKRKPLSVPHSLCGTQNSAGLSPCFHYVHLLPPSLSLPPFSLPNPIPILFPLLSLFSLPPLLSLLSPLPQAILLRSLFLCPLPSPSSHLLTLSSFLPLYLPFLISYLLAPSPIFF